MKERPQAETTVELPEEAARRAFDEAQHRVVQLQEVIADIYQSQPDHVPTAEARKQVDQYLSDLSDAFEQARQALNRWNEEICRIKSELSKV